MAKAMTQETKDEKVQQLLAVVEKQKAEIAKAERPKWETNCSFAFNEENSTVRFNLQTVSDIDVIVKSAAFLIGQHELYEKAKEDLGVESTFKWFGQPIKAWLSDFRTRIGKIQIAKTKAKLEAAETALNNLLSQETKEAKQLEQLTKDLLGDLK